MTTELQLAWVKTIDSELSTKEKTWYIDYVIFKGGERVIVQDDGDGEFSIVCTDTNDEPTLVQTGFKDKLAAQKWFEENAFTLIPALKDYAKEA